MEMTGQQVSREFLQNCIQNDCNLFRCSGANGVCKPDFMTAHLSQCFCHTYDSHGIDRSIIWAIRNHGNTTAHRNTRILGRFDDRFKSREAFVDRAIDIGFAEPFGGGGEYGHLIGVRVACAIKSFEIRCQGRIGYSCSTIDTF